MATSVTTTPQAADLKPTLQAAAKNLLFHLYGEGGPPWGTSFADLEELAVQLGQTLSTELLRQGLSRQAHTPPDRAADGASARAGGRGCAGVAPAAP